MSHTLNLTTEELYKRRVRLFYRTYRRDGLRPAQALARAKNSVAFFTGAIAIMDASDWKADPIAIARNNYATQ